MEWSQLLSHSHWITFHVYQNKVRLCTRCLGTVLGFLTFSLLLFSLNVYNNLIIILLSIVFCAPAIIDWLSQSWGYRQSTNNLRLLTGFLQGGGIVLFSKMLLPFTLKFVFLLYIISLVFAIGTLGKWLTARQTNCTCSRGF
ncbi:DUF2085 domain-containing protein [[Eubacterium] cellulosolvens]